MFNFFKKISEHENKKEYSSLMDEETKNAINHQVKIDRANISFEQIRHMLRISWELDTVNNHLKSESMEITHNRVENLFVNVYKDTYMMEDISDFEEYVTSNIKKLIFEYLDINYDFMFSNIEDKTYLISTTEPEFKSEFSKYDFSKSVYEILNGTKEVKFFEDEELEKILKLLLDFDDPNATQRYLVKLIIHFVTYVMGIMYLIVLSRGRNKFLNSNELFAVANNLYDEFDEETALDKLFDIYKELYDNKLESIRKQNFIRHLFEEKKAKLNLELINRYSFEYMKNDFLKSLRFIKEHVEEYLTLDKIDNLTYEQFEKIAYICYRNEKRDVEQAYAFIVMHYINSFGNKDLVKVVLDYFNIRNKMWEKSKKDKAEEKKQAYLKGNFDNEKDADKNEIKYEVISKKDKLNLDNVNSGVEFENYLKYIFEELGYEVETTKASGDQGADLIITKGEVRTAVQAKFYSSTVGNKAVQEVVASMKFYNATNAMVVTNNYYTSGARELAKANGVSLWDKDMLESIVLTMG